MTPATVLFGALCSCWMCSCSMVLIGCASADDGDRMVSSEMKAEVRPDGTIVDDRSLCASSLGAAARKDVEVNETAGPGAIQPNVRRIWRVYGTGADRRKVLVCREVDTNLDGFKDVMRLYNDEGQSKKEMADTNYDGKIDTWNLFAKGRIAEVHLDRNYDGHADEWKVFTEGKLSRVRRDSNFDKRPDVWEMYRKGRLERMGVDLDGDERVDRWDHDSEWRKRLEADQKKKEDEAEKQREEDAEKRRKEAEAAGEAEAEKE